MIFGDAKDQIGSVNTEIRRWSLTGWTQDGAAALHLSKCGHGHRNAHVGQTRQHPGETARVKQRLQLRVISRIPVSPLSPQYAHCSRQKATWKWPADWLMDVMTTFNYSEPDVLKVREKQRHVDDSGSRLKMCIAHIHPKNTEKKKQLTVLSNTEMWQQRMQVFTTV